MDRESLSFQTTASPLVLPNMIQRLWWPNPASRRHGTRTMLVAAGLAVRAAWLIEAERGRFWAFPAGAPSPAEFRREPRPGPAEAIVDQVSDNPKAAAGANWGFIA